MSYAPATIRAVRAYLLPRTGLSPAALGIVGDLAHARRASYHNGYDRIVSAGRTRATDYSIRTDRDWRGKTDAAAALDIGNFPRLRSLSVWLVQQARANKPYTSDIRELIYSPDGRTVLRWDRERGFRSLPRQGEADSSHLWHTHISWYRDSEPRGKVGLFRAYFEPQTVPAYSARISGRTMTYAVDCRELGEVSGLTVLVARRVSLCGHWRFRIVSGKYAGRYLPAWSTVTYTPLP